MNRRQKFLWTAVLQGSQDIFFSSFQRVCVRERECACVCVFAVAEGLPVSDSQRATIHLMDSPSVSSRPAAVIYSRRDLRSRFAALLGSEEACGHISKHRSLSGRFSSTKCGAQKPTADAHSFIWGQAFSSLVKRRKKKKSDMVINYMRWNIIGLGGPEFTLGFQYILIQRDFCCPSKPLQSSILKYSSFIYYSIDILYCFLCLI